MSAQRPSLLATNHDLRAMAEGRDLPERRRSGAAGARVEAAARTSHCYYRHDGPGPADLFRPVLGSIQLVVVPQERVQPRHEQGDYRLVLVQRGRYRCRLNGQLLELKPRDLLLVKRGDGHEELLGAGLELLTVNFDLARGIHSPSTDILFRPDTAPQHQVIRGPNRDIRRLLDRMRAESEQPDPFVAYVEHGLLLQLFGLVARAIPPERLSRAFLERPAAQGFRERLYRVFEQNLGQNFSAHTLAAKLGLSMRTLTKRCQDVSGCPPARAFTQYKMEHAARALRESDMPIKEISHRLGFQNQYHFSRVFRRCIGAAPSRYRLMPEAEVGTAR